MNLLTQILRIYRFYKSDNFINDIAFGASSFVLCDLNTYFQFWSAINFLRSPVIFFKMFENGKIAPTWKWQIFETILMFY